MKLALQLAYKNLMGAGLKTWLNVGILAFTFILIVFYNGFMDGWNRQSVNDSIAWENGHGQLWNEAYDASDPFSIQDGHGTIDQLEIRNLTPILVRQGTLYPEGRMISVLIKGIDAQQATLKLPTKELASENETPFILVGQKFANANKLKEGDEVLLRWRDVNGTFDALQVQVASIFETDVSSVDLGQVWMDITVLQKLTGLEGRASFLVANEEYDLGAQGGWIWKSNDTLLAGLYNIIASKKASGAIMYLLLLSIALLAIFDTQVLSIFRRQKEIGTYIALGMTRFQVVKLFTVEGAMYSMFAAIAAFIVGAPLLGLAAAKGIPIPEASQNTGVNIGGIIFPYFGLTLILTTLVLVILAATIVSYLPARKISKMDPVLALKGKLQ